MGTIEESRRASDIDQLLWIPRQPARLNRRLFAIAAFTLVLVLSLLAGLLVVQLLFPEPVWGM